MNKRTIKYSKEGVSARYLIFGYRFGWVSMSNLYPENPDFRATGAGWLAMLGLIAIPAGAPLKEAA